VARILSVDYGSKRTGIAVTAPLKLIAGGLAAVATSQLIEWLRTYLAREEVELLVVGDPKQPNGQPSENRPRVMAFVRQFEREFPLIPVRLYDERFTSVMAHQAMIDGGLRRKARRDKALVDEISATIILQSYLESIRI